MLDEPPSPSERQSKPEHEEEGPVVSKTLLDEMIVGTPTCEVITDGEKVVSGELGVEVELNSRLIEALTQRRFEHP